MTVAAGSPDTKLSAAALWSGGFRPFYLAGCAWGLLAVCLWALGHYGGWAVRLSQPAWHGHEMVYGFAGALCGGFILTALPSWAGTPMITGRPLALLLAAWAAGRVAVLLPGLPPAVTAAADLAYLPLLTAMVGPGVWAARNRLYRLLPVILAILIAGNATFHLGAVTEAEPGMTFGIRLGLYGLMLLYSFVAGLLTPIFGEADARVPATFRMPVEVLAALSLVAVAAADLGRLPPVLVAAAALAATVVHTARMAPWRTRSLLGSPLVLAMHIGYGWLIVSLCLRATAALGPEVALAPSAAVHAFTLGAFGLTKLSLMTRVALKHTGRPLTLRPLMTTAFAGMAMAALARLVAEVGVAAQPLLTLSVLAWLTAMALYLIACGPFLWRPSLPRR